MLWLGFSLGIAAWCLLSLGLEKHHRQLFARAFDPRRGRWLRAAGWLLLVLDFALFVAGWGWSQGPVFWCAALMLSALAWTLLMTLAPRASTRVAIASVLSALALMPVWMG